MMRRPAPATLNSSDLMHWCADLPSKKNNACVTTAHSCPGQQNLLSRKQLSDRYEKLVCELHHDVDSLLHLWSNVLHESRRPQCWNLAAGIGGEAFGVMGAGFDLVAVEIQSRCQDEFPTKHPRTGALARFVCADLWQWLTVKLETLHCDRPDFVCGGMPCQSYCGVPLRAHSKCTKRWVKPMRRILEALERDLSLDYDQPLAWCLENVPGAKADMLHPTKFCGSAMGLEVFRHRVMDSNYGMDEVKCNHHRACVGTKSPYLQNPKWAGYQIGKCRCNGNMFQLFGGHVGELMGTLTEQQRALRMTWGNDAKLLHQCIPPVYALYSSRFALQHIVQAKLEQKNIMPEWPFSENKNTLF